MAAGDRVLAADESHDLKGTVLGAVDFSEFEEASQRYRIRGIDDFVPIPREQWGKRQAHHRAVVAHAL